MNFLDNITFRRTRTRSEPDNDSNISQNETVNSMPDMSEDDDYSQLKTLKVEVEKLTSQLNSAHKEIELLSLENSKLKKQNDELGKKNELLKIINSPAKRRATPKKAINRNTKGSQTDNLINILETKSNESSSCTESITMDKPKISNIQRQKKTSKTKENQIATQQEQKRPKVCILSTDNKNKLLEIAENVLNRFEICHYIIPLGNTQILLKGIKQKLKNFSTQDYCIILLGEEDFKSTNNYLDTIFHIRNTLQELNHTNIIICTPTYKFFNNNYLYNSRVETFNNLLYLDVLTHEHAYFLDSNFNLNYDDTMFDRRTGIVKNAGLQIIFKNIKDMIISIQSSNNIYIEDTLTYPSIDPNYQMTQNDTILLTNSNDTDEVIDNSRNMTFR